MIHLVVTIDIRPARMNEFLRLVASHRNASIAEPGCVQFDVMRSGFQFALYEVWESEKDLASHRQTAHYAHWRELMPEIESRSRVREEYQTLLSGG